MAAVLSWSPLVGLPSQYYNTVYNVAVKLTAAANQLIFQPGGTGNTFSITAATPGQNTVLTIPDPGGATASFVLTNSVAAQTIVSPVTLNASGAAAVNIGTGTYSGTVTIGNASATAVTFPVTAITVNSSAVAASRIVKVNNINPAATTSATSVMMGMGASVAITPTFSGKLRVSFYGQATQQFLLDMLFAQIEYGTGTAPVNGVAFTGTSLGTYWQMTAQSAGEARSFNLSFIVTGLTIATAYWFDLAVRAGTGGAGHTATVSSIYATIEEFA